MLSGHFGAECDFEDFGEAGFAQAGEELFDGAGELVRNRGGHHRDDRAAAFHRGQDVGELRTLHDRTERTGAEALAAVDAVLEIDAHAAVLAFADRSDRAGVFARQRIADDRVVRADRHALAAVDALGAVDGRTLVDHLNRLLRTDSDAGTGEAADATVADLHVAVDAAVAADGADRKHRAGVVAPIDGVGQILLELAGFVLLLFHAEAHQGHQPVFEHGAVFVDAAAVGLLRPRAQFNRNAVDGIGQRPVEKLPDESDH